MKNKGEIEGYIVSVEPYGKTATVIIQTEETDYKTKQKHFEKHTFKAIGEKSRDNLISIFETYGRSLVMIEYRKLGEEERKTKEGKTFTTKDLKITRIWTEGGEPTQEPQQPDKQAEPHQVDDDESDLPF